MTSTPAESKPVAKAPAEPSEKPGDDMADAPPARPYSEAITDEHRQVLIDAGLWRDSE